MQYWKIITRRGSLVTATNATDYEELSGSRHKIQLLNLPFAKRLGEKRRQTRGQRASSQLTPYNRNNP